MTDLSATDNRLQATRGRAIAAYAEVEHSLCNLFEYFIGSVPQVASMIFYRISALNTRNNLLEELLHHKCGSSYDIYWYGEPTAPRKSRGGMMALIRNLDSMRNNIVHWHIGLSFTFDGDTVTSQTPVLMHPATFTVSDHTVRLQEDDLQVFIHKAEFVRLSLTVFHAIISGKTNDGFSAQTWKRIFQRPAIYPPESDHPLAQLPKEP